jgi:hypothetical protein
LQQQIKISFRKKLRGDCIQVMLATVHSRTSCLLVCCLKHKTIILPVVLYGCESSSLTSKEEHRLRVPENRVLRRVFGLKRDEMMGGWKKLHNEEVHNPYSSPRIIRLIKSRRIKWAGHVEHMGKKRNACRILVGKPGGERPLRRPRCRWEDDIKNGSHRDRTGLIWLRIGTSGGLVKTVMNLQVP